ncbi:MAG: saccharopine dehydrogenase C-terminal domain-containing protein [Promethearchaeota archaeon]
MKHVLCLGAGLVARPYIDYLLKKGYQVTVASRTVSKAERMINGRSNGTPVAFDIQREPERLKDLVAPVDLVTSLLPYTHHVTVATECLRQSKHMTTTSYVSDGMRALDAKAKKEGVILLNECGVDPGLDHMSAMKVIHEAQANGGTIRSFTSFCGGLPAPDANNNPFGYKLSWSPRGVLLAGTNSARFIKDGKEVVIPSEELFNSCHEEEVPGLGTFEGYPNRDSTPYVDIYGVKETKTMLRGTLRYLGWCATIYDFGRMGLLDLTEQDFTGKTYEGFVRELVKAPSGVDTRAAVAKFLKRDEQHNVLERFNWLGLFDDRRIPLERSTALDVVCTLFEEKLQYAPGERDMLVMQHKFEIEYAGGRKERVRSTLIDYGIPHGDTSMSRTVAYPVAIASRLILEGEISLTGVQIPIIPEIYESILAEIAEFDIRFKEETF